MEFFTSVIDRVKGFVKDSRRRASTSSIKTNPIEVLKRLQREAFSDIMRLRDRQDKLERVISSKYDQGNPFQEANTHLKGMINVSGALFFAQDDGHLTFDTLDRTGIKRGTGTSLKFIFETMVRQKDVLVTEFTSGHNNANAAQNTLALDKVKYLACIDDWLSLIFIPLGAQCSDFGIISNAAKRMSLPEPTFFSQYHNHAAGLVIKGSNNALASLAGLYSDSGRVLESSTGAAASDTSFLGTFGQVSCELFEEARLTLSGLWLKPNPIAPFARMAPLTMSVKRTRDSGAQATTTGRVVPGSASLMLEAEIDENARLGGWVEAQKANRSWGIFLFDTPEDELGWGLRLERSILFASSNLSVFEGLLNLNFGKRLRLQPSLMYLLEGSRCSLACSLRANWTM